MREATAAGSRIVRLLLLAWLGASAAGVSLAADEPQPSRFKGLSLSAALANLQRSGLKVLFSTELVRPDMIVTREASGRVPYEILEELLAPHGLRSIRGPSGAWLVVKAPPPVKTPSRGSSAPIERQEVTPPHLYSERVMVRAADSAEPTDRRWLARADVQASPDFASDPLLVMARLPGVATSGGSGGLHVRGGGSREAKIILDGLELYEPYHLKDRGGPISIVDSSTIGQIGVLSGGFPAEYGGHMSAVIEMDTVAPSDDREFVVAMSSGDARIAGQGRAGSRLRWIVSGRRGDPSRLLDALDVDPAYRPAFSDVFAKAEYQLNERTRLSFHLLGADEEVEGGGREEVIETVYEPGTFKARHTHRYAWVTLERALSNTIVSRTVLSAARLTNDRQGSGPRVVAVRDARSTDVFGLRQDWLRQSSRHLVKWGVDVKGLQADYRYISIPSIQNASPMTVAAQASPIELTKAPAGIDAGAWVADRFRLGSRLDVELGLRWEVQTYTPHREGMLSPRLNAVYSLGEGRNVRVAWGSFYQPQKIHELSVPDGVWEFLTSERAEHRVVSYDHELGGGVVVQLGAYQNRMIDLNPRFENLFDVSGFFPEANDDRVKVDPERARAEGIELSVRRAATPKAGWWAAYTLARAEDLIDGRWVPRSWDQRHAIAGGLAWKPTPRWEIALAGSHHSGRPTTPVIAGWSQPDSGAREMVTPVGARNSLRLLPYHRVDFRVGRSVPIGRSDLSATLTVSGAFGGGSVNPEGPNRLMTFGVSWKF